MSEAKCRFKITISVAQEQALMILHITWKNEQCNHHGVHPPQYFLNNLNRPFDFSIKQQKIYARCIASWPSSINLTKFWVNSSRILPLVIGKSGGTLGMVPLMVPYDSKTDQMLDLSGQVWQMSAKSMVHGGVPQVCYGNSRCDPKTQIKFQSKES